MSGQGGRMTSWLRRARDADGAVIAELYLAAFRAVYDFPLAHTDDEVRAWVRDVVVGTSETWVVVEAPLERAAVWPLTEDLGEIAGFVTISPGELDQLYIRPDSWGRGHGSRLLALAKVRSPEGLDLYTFQANARARAFYERHAFEVVDLDGGERNEERQPDIRYRWTA
ncbi:MAG TPA: GNAT family N-acetyltransferase, partial [Candidatus Acidoferrum sp.]|nr:GNAT family N-acetyltransferase [Candidatus Acidoferrum sp.]